MSAVGDIECGEFTFFNNFDSANLARVEQVQPPNKINNEPLPNYEFNLWTNHDCQGTEFQNNNRTWFYFGIRANIPGVCVKFNIINLNKQVKMFNQGMCPVFKVVPGHPNWERIKDKPTYLVNRLNKVDEKAIEFNLSFTFTTPENTKAITYFAFTYPFTYTDLQTFLRRIDIRMSKRLINHLDDIYYHRECAIKSLEGRRLELLTISSYHNISSEKEMRIPHMFPEENEERPFKFRNKKVVFISARVHPGETPSSFVINGFINFLLTREDPVAITLRRLYVFKFLPMLNPDGVARGHYRMDTKGVNLNRVYLNPSRTEHPTIYAARNLIRYHHHRYELPDETASETEVTHVDFQLPEDKSIPNGNFMMSAMQDTNMLLNQVTLMSLDEKEDSKFGSNKCVDTILRNVPNNLEKSQRRNNKSDEDCNKKTFSAIGLGHIPADAENTGLFLYIDLHGHASKKGIFMYGNYFNDPEDSISCMLLPKLMSINNTNFHFSSCNFAERNMYLIDKRDGMSREGSGRVAVYRLTGLIRSYTLECNYNSGRLVNAVPPRVRDGMNGMKPINHTFVPPKYTPLIFEEVGAALGPSILDLTSTNPNSRLPNSQYRSLRGIKSYLKMTYFNNFTVSLNKRFHKDTTVETVNSEPSVLKLNPVSIENIKETEKPVKKCISRQSTSICMAMKKMKGKKIVRKAPSRKPSKGSVGNDMENNPAVSKIVAAQMRGQKKKVPLRSTVKTKPLKKVTKKSVEEIAAVKQGSKRLKVVSKNESQDAVSTDGSVKAVSKVLVFDKLKIKSTFSKIQKSHKSEQKKLQKSSRMEKKLNFAYSL